MPILTAKKNLFLFLSKIYKYIGNVLNIKDLHSLATYHNIIFLSYSKINFPIHLYLHLGHTHSVPHQFNLYSKKTVSGQNRTFYFLCPLF